jgi:hypothetical protein
MTSKNVCPPLDVLPLIACVLAGVLYWAIHLFNAWVFQWGELNQHINLVYLPSFLRLANVLVLGLVLGTAGTAIGGLLLIWWSQDEWLLCLLNISVSASAAALAVVGMRILMGRRLSPTRLMDLFLLSILCAIISASLHHLLWSVLDTSQLINPMQLPYMMIGDVNGALIGALLLRWVARYTKIADFLRQRTEVTN